MKKVNISTSKLWIASACVLLLSPLAGPLIKTALENEQGIFSLMKTTHKSRQLNYVIHAPRVPITLDLFEAELYHAAIVVQPLIGNLVYYSNQGRYEPRLAKSWRRPDPFTWEFELHTGSSCENGELITPKGFKKSLERTFRIMSKGRELPVFNRLVGYKAFAGGASEISGLEAGDKTLTFRFDRPTRTGVTQLLSFGPFGYICAENLNDDGSWKDKTKFIASGPYRVEGLSIGERYALVKNPGWALPFAETAPEKVLVTHQVPQSIPSGEYWIVDGQLTESELPEGLDLYPLVPEYHTSILLGNLEKGYFSDANNRRYFRKLLEEQRERQLPEKWGRHIRARSMYPNQAPASLQRAPVPEGLTPPSEPLLIEGGEPPVTNSRRSAWEVLINTLQKAGIPFRLNGNQPSMGSISNRSFDIRLSGASIGGGVEAWGLAVLFCAKVGFGLPDPNHRICKMLDEYETTDMSDEELTTRFLKQVEEDSAIISISHYGMSLYLSDSIVREALSPTLSIMRFDQMELR